MVTSKIIASGILKALGFVSAIILLCFFLFEIQTVILYIVISLVLTLIGGRIKEFLIKRFKFNNLFASITTILFFVSIILSFALMFVPLIISQIESLALLNTLEIKKSVLLVYDHFTVFLNRYGIESDKVLKQSNWQEKIDFKTIPNFLNILIGTLSDFGIGLVSVLFITFFFLKDRDLIVSGVKSIIPNKHETKILSSF